MSTTWPMLSGSATTVIILVGWSSLRTLAIGLAAAVAIALLAAASPSADAAGKGKGAPVATESLTIVHEGLKGKKPSSVKAKGKDSTKGRHGYDFLHRLQR